MSNWFAVKRLDADTYLVAEPGHVNNYLIIGEERAVLFDTGLGVRDIAAAVAGVTYRPVMAVNSHHHFDHVGGNDDFADVAVHQSGAGLLEQGPPPGWLSGYAAGVPAVLEAFAKFEALDDAWFHCLTPETTMRPWPHGIEQRWSTPRRSATRLLSDGDRIELGGRALEVLHVPGHAPDQIALFDPGSGRLFVGDAYATGPNYAQLTHSDPGTFVLSLRRLAALGAAVTTVHPAHIMRYTCELDELGAAADAFDAILAGEGTSSQTVDCFGSSVQEHSFNGFSLVLP